ncbi:hypothetical protein [Calothrix sp. 336/3]|uniref:hypothetical protein n=1 Tax=Calothrix sp. 336/3 TaxID=1337936 RepID=UPI000B10A673|nr:hypothetical protein [Calothrix sp. 336/3]
MKIYQFVLDRIVTEVFFLNESGKAYQVFAHNDLEPELLSGNPGSKFSRDGS